jgi:hypothetical protein
VSLPKVGLPKRVTLKFSIRGRDGEREHSLVVVMRRRAERLLHLDAMKSQWRATRLELRARGRVRNLNPRRLTHSQREDLADQAERAAYAKLGMRIPGEGF